MINSIFDLHKKKLLQQGAYLFILFIFAGVIPTQAADPVHFVIRVDDIQSRNTTMVPKEITYFEAMVEAHSAKVTWAVIPHRLIESQNTDGQLRNDLLASVARGHEILMHGYNHICPLCSQSSHEMYCTTYQTAHSYQTQYQLLSDSYDLLSDSCSYTASGFVPPGHHADSTTYNALVDMGLDIISTTGTGPGFIREGLFNLPPNNEYTWALTAGNYQSQLNAALNDISIKAADRGYYCLLLHDPFIRQGYENGIVINWVDELLDSLQVRYGSDLVFSTVTEAADYLIEKTTPIESGVTSNLQEKVFASNYPNPFNPQTRIVYYLPGSAHVELNIYNSLGQKVAVLVNGLQSVGTHELNWNAYGLSSGVYIYQIKTQSADRKLNQIFTGKCLLLK